MKTFRLVSLVALGAALSACSAPLKPSPPSLSAPRDVQVSAQVGQVRHGFFEVTNPGGAPLEYRVAETADWLELTSATTGRLEPGGAASLGFTARCSEVPGTVQAILTVTPDGSERHGATTQVTLVCADALAVGAEGFMAALGSWNWAAQDDGTLGTALLLGFRYSEPVTVAVTVAGPPGWNGGAPRHLVLPGPTGTDPEDVWTYDLLTDADRAAPTGTYHVTATTSRGDSYALDLTNASGPFLGSPKNVAVTPVAGGVTVSWTPPAGAQAYYVVVTDPSDEEVPQQMVPQRAATPASGLDALAVPVHASAFSATTSLKLAASLSTGKRYQVTVVAFSSALVLGDTATTTVGVEAAARFDASSATTRFSYTP